MPPVMAMGQMYLRRETTVVSESDKEATRRSTGLSLTNAVSRAT